VGATVTVAIAVGLLVADRGALAIGLLLWRRRRRTL
jgi:hypothetical protein